MIFKRLLRKLKQVFCIIGVLFTKSRSPFLRTLKYEVENYLEDCCNSGTKSIEELQDLLFHINSYFEIPEATRITMFPDMKYGFKLILFGYNFYKYLNRKFPSLYVKYVQEVEKQRAVERFYIMELLKYFPFESEL